MRRLSDRMKKSRFPIYLLIIICALSLSFARNAHKTHGEIMDNAGYTPADESIASVIDKYKELIPGLMKEYDIPGIAIAVTDETRILWAQGFGYTDIDYKIPINTDTLFSIQSMSKSFTATAVMLAVQDGMLDLDTPITDYLPDFKVQSIFEDNPEKKITLRHLLTHTAGFTHEAPVGNNYDIDASTFEAHIESISDTWLMFPVGESYSYSNLGMDLAGYILQVKSGVPYAQYLNDKLLKPLGMVSSSFDINTVKDVKNRAIGHSENLYRQVPLKIPMLPAGGLYTNVLDFTKYIRFHMNFGKVDSSQIVSKDLLTEMYINRFGIGMGENHNTYNLAHGGGGFGFISMMIWYPELKIGIVMLTNSTNHDLQFELPNNILEGIINSSGSIYGTRASNINPASNLYPQSIKTQLAPPDNSKIYLKIKDSTKEKLSDWNKYTGMYFYTVWNRFAGIHKIQQRGGVLYVDDTRLSELRPGLFFTDTGEVLDMRNTHPTYCSIKLRKMNLVALGTAIIFSLLAFLLVLFNGLFSGTKRLLQRRRLQVSLPSVKQSFKRRFLITTVCILDYVACILGITYISYIIYNFLSQSAAGGVIERFISLLPCIMVLISSIMAALTVLLFKYKCADRFFRIHHVLILIAAITLILSVVWLHLF